MDLGRKRVAPNSSKNGVVVGSVWESRMKGSLKVFNGDDKNQENEKNGVGGGGKRKTWKSDGNSDGNERSPVQISKARSENKKELGELSKGLSDSMDGIGIKKSPVQMKKGRPEWNKVKSVSIDGIERNPVQRTIKTQSLSRKVSTNSDLADGIEKVKPISTKEAPIGDECNHGIEETEGGNVGDDEMKKSRSDCSENSDELDVCEEKLMTVDLGKVKSLDTEDKPTMEENEEVNEERAIVVVKEMEPISTINKKKSPDVVIEDKKIHHRNERSNHVSRTVRKQLPPVIISHHKKFPNPIPDCRVFDLIMWKDASKSALVFGLGTFSILSSSYTQDLHISFISVISYLSLIYLAAIFIFKSFIFRGVVEADNITDDEEYVLGEEEATWALKLFLPYINEFLLKVKALFSDGSAALYFGKMWQLYNHLENGQIGSVLQIQTAIFDKFYNEDKVF
ncbi:hypothetical protein L1987_29842 [Smallanthus sonchifolius]|uniref:Uncharacterized protein n=1 Tax=Smallanthus sonchifolius TaxID=185202 RepID=A0ACB9I0L3_9ASTR|nr:hypothetical protein L1987_29842 [Smallanthus sonchifolius]